VNRPRCFLGLGRVPADLGPTAVTIGVFDGLHRGHQALLGRVAEEAAARGLLPGAITFDRHPMTVVRPGSQPKLLSTLSQRVALLGECGMAFVLVLQFTPKQSRMAAEEFAVKVLLETVQARVVVVGHNFRFGHRAAGDARLIAELAQPRGVDVIDLPLDDDAGDAVSSTRVRTALAHGDVEAAARLLGRPFSVEGHVVRGAGRGRLLGIPTANLAVPARLMLPRKGVYAGHLQVAGTHGSRPWAMLGSDGLRDAERLEAVSNVGVSPQFGGTDLRVETYVLDFDGDLYGKRVRVTFEHRLRDEAVFPDVDALVNQMQDDIALTRRLLEL
jgi:riboflavin kinase/FMN adenylyltransferase